VRLVLDGGGGHLAGIEVLVELGEGEILGLLVRVRNWLARKSAIAPTRR
jgi:hypothetical protein